MIDCDDTKHVFSQNEIDNFVAFSSTLKRIHKRLIGEGYVIKDGTIYKPEGDKLKPIIC
jgi:hypothetical protein